MFDEALLKSAFDQYHQDLFASLPSTEELGMISLSDRLEQRMERLLRRQKRFYYPLVNTALKRAACFVGAVLITGAAVAVGFGGDPVGGAKEEKSYFTYYFYDDTVSVNFINTELHPDTTRSIGQKKAPAYLPEGYEMVQDRSDTAITELIYEGEGYDCFYYAQYPNGYSASGSTENAEYKQTRIDGNEALLFIGQEVTQLIFNDGEYLYFISGTLSEKEIVKIAKSIE